MKFDITKEQVLAIEKLGGADVSLYLKEYFAEAFKTELEVGKWYKRKMEGYIETLLFFITSFSIQKHAYGYGVRENGDWFNCQNENPTTCACNNVAIMEAVEASPEEAETALINEAKKRGYKEGVRIKGLASGNSRIIPDGKFEFLSNNVLWFGNPNEGYDIFRDGKWAEIIPQEKTVVPMEKALKIIAKKMKVSPENIEICSNTKE